MVRLRTLSSGSTPCRPQVAEIVQDDRKKAMLGGAGLQDHAEDDGASLSDWLRGGIGRYHADLPSSSFSVKSLMLNVKISRLFLKYR